ncbi:hypothetical protein IW262DRAFT_270855 [Armillaria fumosa]|nr:hypothetical protein IW262DRAFT_270855 [Armillaria fumosa]
MKDHFRQQEKGSAGQQPSQYNALEHKRFIVLTDHLTDVSNKALPMLTETLQVPHWGYSSSPLHSPFNCWSKYSGTIYSLYQSVEAEKGVRLGLTMKGWSDSIEMWAVVNAFPWGSLRDGAIV